MSININYPNLKILLIQFKPVGDVLLLTPVIKAIKEYLPHSHISFMVNEKESILIKDSQYIDNLILIKKLPKNNLVEYFKYLKYNLLINTQTRKKKYDIVIDYIGNPKSAVVTGFSGASLKIGRKLGFRSLVYNYRIDRHKKNTNTITRRLRHLIPLGIKIDYLPTHLHLNKEEISFANKFINSLKTDKSRPVIFMAPNSPRSSRRWIQDYFITTGKSLIKKYNAIILLGWGPGEEEYTKTILNGIDEDSKMIPLTTLKEMAAIISKSNLVITVESGTKHLANAVGIRTITIYGPTNPNAWNDIDTIRNPVLRADVPCIQCEKRKCPFDKHICMEKVTPDMVLNAVDKILT